MKETDSKVTGAFFNKVYSSICVPCTEVSHEGDSTTIILQNWIFFIPPIETFSLSSLRWAWIVCGHHVHVEYTQQNHDLPKRSFFHLNIPFLFFESLHDPVKVSGWPIPVIQWVKWSVMVNHPMVVKDWRKWGRFGSFKILFSHYYCAV